MTSDFDRLLWSSEKRELLALIEGSPEDRMAADLAVYTLALASQRPILVDTLKPAQMPAAPKRSLFRRMFNR